MFLQLISKKKQQEQDRYLGYIESTGTQYIDTGIIGASGIKVRYTLSVMGLPNTNNVGVWIGCRATTGNTRFFQGVWVKSDGTVTLDSALGTDFATAWTPTLGTKYNISWETSSTGFSQSVDGTAMGSGSAVRTNTINMYLFGNNVQFSGEMRNGSKIRLYSCQIYNADGEMIRNYRPYLKDGVPCLYDAVNGTYHYNSGTGDFLYGERLIPTECYTPNKEVSYITTDVKYNSDQPFMIKSSGVRINTYTNGFLYSTNWDNQLIRWDTTSGACKVYGGSQTALAFQATPGLWQKPFTHTIQSFKMGNVNFSFTPNEALPVASDNPLWLFNKCDMSIKDLQVFAKERLALDAVPMENGLYDFITAKVIAT